MSPIKSSRESCAFLGDSKNRSMTLIPGRGSRMSADKNYSAEVKDVCRPEKQVNALFTVNICSFECSDIRVSSPVMVAQCISDASTGESMTRAKSRLPGNSKA